MTSKFKSMLFRATLVLIPVILVILLEIIVRLVSPGPNLDLTIPVRDNPGMARLNPEIGLRYFPRADMTGFGQDRSFRQQKIPGTIRIITLGGSTTAGFPYFYSGSFPSLLETRLKAEYPENSIEVINLGLTAVNSYTVLDLIPDCLELQPDAIVIYCGHNEFYGAFGSASQFGLPDWLRSQRWVTKLVLTLRHVRMYQMISSWVMPNHEEDERPLMSQIYQSKTIPYNSELYQQTMAHFQENMEDVLDKAARAQVPVVLSTISSNLTGQEPFELPAKSLDSDPDWKKVKFDIQNKDWSTALSLINVLIKTYPNSPQLDFQMGKCDLNLGDTTRALSLFVKARDLDGIRFRAPSDINNILRDLSSESQVGLADVDSMFYGFPPSRIPSQNPFLEHLHPTLNGNARIAHFIADRLIRLPDPESIFPSPPKTNTISDQMVLKRARITPLDKSAASIQIKILTSNPPYTRTPGLRLVDIKPQSKIDELALRMLAGKISYREGHLELAAYWQSRQEDEKAVLECDALVHQYPEDAELLKALASASMRTPNHPRTLSVLQKLTDMNPEDAFGQKWRGLYELDAGHLEASDHWLTQAIRSKDDDQTRYNLAGVKLRLGQTTAALTELDTLLKRNPNYPNAMNLRRQIRLSLKKTSQ